MRREVVHFIFVFLILSYSCGKNETSVERVLSAAGENKAEIHEFLSFYKNDSIKLKAAEFLVFGMENHYTYDILLRDSLNNQVSLNLYQPKINRKNVFRMLDSLQYSVKDTVKEDLKSIKSDYLKQNLEQAFDVWKNKPWAKKYHFELFREFILPYRVGNESLINDWRTFFRNRYLPTLDTLQGANKVETVFQFIKNDIEKWFKFDDNSIDLKPTMTLNQILSYQKGNCIDVANVFVYALRAIGVASAKDHIPLWGHDNYGHCELVYWDENNKPQTHQVENWSLDLPPKVYRRYYSSQKDNLSYKVRNLLNAPPHLTEITYRDVTNEYTRTSTVFLKPFRQPENKILYLSAFNSGRWQPIAWSDSILKKTNEYVFKYVGRNIAYLPSTYRWGKNIPNGYPFIIGNEGQVRYLKAKKNSLISITLEKISRYDKLFYWDNKWINIGKNKSYHHNRDSLRFDNVPSNTLYRLIESKRDNNKRIFTYEDGKQRFW